MHSLDAFELSINASWSAFEIPAERKRHVETNGPKVQSLDFGG
jgi:hypothetical protein